MNKKTIKIHQMIRILLLTLHNVFFTLSGKYNLKKKCRILWAFCGVNWTIATFCFNLYMTLYSKFGLFPSKKCDNKSNIIVSLTTFPGRIKSVWMVVDSILHQKVLPSKICLYLSEEEFPNGIQSLPDRLLQYQKNGLEICFRKNNLMAHNKYFYALQEYKNNIVITIDDDFYYNNNMISNLLLLHETYPNVICSNTIHKLNFDSEKHFLPYKKWILRPLNQSPSLLNVALGYNGVLYPPMDYGENIFDTERIRNTSLKADDLWLKACEIVAGIKVANGDYFCTGIEIRGSQAITLNQANVVNGENDKQWVKLCELFNIDYNTFN